MIGTLALQQSDPWRSAMIVDGRVLAFSALALTALTLTALATGSTVRQSAPAYDMALEFKQTAPGYVIRLRNTGPAIPAPFRAAFHLLIPTGVKIITWKPNGWTCAPAPALAINGPADIACHLARNAGTWPAGAMLSSPTFQTVKTPGAAPSCVRATLMMPDTTNTFVVVNESDRNNNAACVQ